MVSVLRKHCCKRRLNWTSAISPTAWPYWPLICLNRAVSKNRNKALVRSRRARTKACSFGPAANCVLVFGSESPADFVAVVAAKHDAPQAAAQQLETAVHATLKFSFQPQKSKIIACMRRRWLFVKRGHPTIFPSMTSHLWHHTYGITTATTLASEKQTHYLFVSPHGAPAVLSG